MKSLRLRTLLAGLFAFPALAQAHPGHDGDHDFVWDFDHFASHPLATFACVAIIATAGWLVWRLIKAPRSAQTVPSQRDRR